MSVPSSHSYAEILTPKVMVCGSAAFDRCLAREGGTLMNGISAHIKETSESSLFPSTTGEHREKMAVNEEGGLTSTKST